MTLSNPFNEIYQSNKFRGVLAHRDKPTDFPQMIDIELTNHCNLKCLFCGQQDMTRDKGFITKELMQKVVNECKEHNTPIRLIRWGEPLLHPEVIDLCRTVKYAGLPLHITTNGILLTENKMFKLLEMRLDSIIFSFQGATKEGYEKMRNNNQYDLLKENILKFVEMRGTADKPYIKITSTMTDETEEEIQTFKDYWGKIVDEVMIGKTNLNRVKVDERLKEKETVVKCHRPCTEVYQKLSMDWDGKVSACCSDWDNFLTVGDVSKTSLKDIWDNSEELKHIRGLLDKMRHKSLTICSVCYHTYQEF